MNTVDEQTGEVMDNTLIPYALDIFLAITAQPVKPEQAQILLEKIKPEDLDILPTGEIYLTQIRYRDRLNRAFGPGGWAMRPLSQPYVKDELAMQEWALYANGQFMAYAVGGAEYRESNNRMNWSDVLETVKSNALMRLCKDLGIAAECWDRRYTTAFKNEYCVKVWIKDKNKPQWRRLDAEPFRDELKPTDDSPNRDKFGFAPIQPKQAKAEPKAVKVEPAIDLNQVFPREQGSQATPTNGELPRSPKTLLEYANSHTNGYYGKLPHLFNALKKVFGESWNWPAFDDAEGWGRATQAAVTYPQSKA